MGSPVFYGRVKNEKAFNLPASPQLSIPANVTLSFRSGGRSLIANLLPLCGIKHINDSIADLEKGSAVACKA